VAEDESLFMYKLHGNHSTITFELKSLNWTICNTKVEINWNM
jgi:hypothetical protein